MSGEKRLEILGKTTRVFIKVGNSVVLTVPSRYVQAHKIKPGDLADIYFNDRLVAEPISRKEIQNKVNVELLDDQPAIKSKPIKRKKRGDACHRSIEQGIPDHLTQGTRR